jgi:hypothetical protein
MKDAFLVISTVVGLITPIIGIRAVLRGEYKPHRITRLVLLIVTVLFVTTLFAQNDRTALFLALAQVVGSIGIFILSFKYGVGGTSKMDAVVFIGAMASLVIWKTTNDPALGLYASILTDIIGFSPTIVKAWKDHKTEDWKFYGCDVLASFFNLLALKSLLLNEIVFPIYIFVINLLITSILIYKNSKDKPGKVSVKLEN